VGLALTVSLATSATADDGAISIERALVARARRGDDRAFRRIFERHAAGIRRFLGDLLRDDALADEATQETFVRAHAGLSGIREHAKLRPWLFGIARNVSRERARARQRARREEPLDDEVGPAVVGVAPSPQELLLGREADVVLAGAMSHLDEARRAALLLRIDHDLGYPDIAEIMGWNVAKVKNEIHRARLQLRAALSEYIAS
jgi:RNA polymerase sigma-70 factor (ECF subfamily)